MTERIAAIAVASLLAACDPGFTLQGTISNADGRPAANVNVRVNCSGGLQAETLSDANGRFLGHDIGWYPSYCVIEAIPPGAAHSVTWPMMPSCSRTHGEGACLEVTANLRLP